MGIRQPNHAIDGPGRLAVKSHFIASSAQEGNGSPGHAPGCATDGGKKGEITWLVLVCEHMEIWQSNFKVLLAKQLTRTWSASSSTRSVFTNIQSNRMTPWIHQNSKNTSSLHSPHIYTYASGCIQSAQILHRLWASPPESQWLSILTHLNIMAAH